MGASCRNPVAGYSEPVKAIVIGCGRVGSSIARQLYKDGWEVTAVDEKEDALARLGEDWRGGFVLGHGMDVDVLRGAGIEDANDCVVVRLLDPARAAFYRARGLRIVCPTETAIAEVTGAVRACEIQEPVEAG
jgi:trk/ktr system potassium uptake protein